MPRILVSQAAEILGVSRQMVAKLIKAGKLGRVYWTGPLREVNLSAVERYARKPKDRGGRPKKAA